MLTKLLNKAEKKKENKKMKKQNKHKPLIEVIGEEGQIIEEMKT